MSETLERKRSRYFIYRNPTPSTIEVLSKTGIWYSPFNDESFFWQTTSYRLAKGKAEFSVGAKVALFDELEAIRETINKLAKWKSAHEEKAEAKQAQTSGKAG